MSTFPRALRPLAAVCLLLIVLHMTGRIALAAPPIVAVVSPEPGFVSQLTEVTVTFDQSVTGVQAVDFLLNGVPAIGVNGSRAQYRFTFPQPAYGPVDVSWGTLHTIDGGQDRFDGGALGSTWAYQLFSLVGPSLTAVLPVPGTIRRRLGEIELNFSRPVLGIDAADLRLNGRAATQVTGAGAGPYRFSFPEAGAGAATLE